MVQRATLFNPETKARKAVDVGSAEATSLLDTGGFKLETSFDPNTGISTFEGQEVEAPKAPEVINKADLQSNIQSTFDKYGGAAGANEQFIQGVSKFGTGQSATAEQVASLKGQPLSKVIEDFNIGGSLTGFGMDKPEITDTGKPTEVKVEEPTSPVVSAIDNLIATKQSTIAGGVDTQAFLQEKQDRATDVETARQAIADKKLLDAVKLEALGDKPIPMIEIQKQQQKFSQDEYIDNLKMSQDYNNKLILSQMAQGNFLEAQRINQGIASDNFEIEKLKIDRAREQGLIDSEEAELLRQEEQVAFERASNGYIHITDPKMLEGLTEDKIIRVGDKIYRKPNQDETLSVAEAKSLGVPFGTTKSQAMNMGITPRTGSGGSGSTVGFKLSSDDRGRLLAVDFTNEDINNIQQDINEFGIESVVAGMPENQAKAIRDITSGVTPTQANAEDTPDSITEGKRKVIGGINALMSDNASNEELEEYIKLKGYTKEDFSDLLSGYTPTVSEVKWWEFWKQYGLYKSKR